MKVLLILVDGMRPDALTNLPRAREFAKKSASTMDARTVMPSVTLPCHMSLFHSVEPTRHGTTTNTYAPQVRPINGLFEVLNGAGRTSAFFNSWEELRDVSRVGSLTFSYLYSGRIHGYDRANNHLTDAAIDYLTENDTDFAFLYLGDPDEVGHKYGWMGAEYMASVENSWENIDRVVSALGDDYTVIVTADHGGHERSHGTDMPEDMTIPVFIRGKDFAAGSRLENVSIMDLAPTVTKILGVEPDRDWEGKSLL